MQLGFHIDQTRCTGCCTCRVACKDWNDIPPGPASWRQMSSVEEGEWPDLFVAYSTSSCYHCAEPICAIVCPAKAISKRDEDGIVLVDREKCRTEVPCGIITNRNGIPFAEMPSPCSMACPAGVNAQGYIALISKGRFQEALDLIYRELPLPSVCGRVCKRPCESVCKRKELDEPIAILALKRFVTDRVVSVPDPLPITKRQKVAIVGSGPAGLSAAWGLAKKGYPVTVFEALPIVGGMLAVGIPDYRLPKEVLQRDVDYLKALGIQIKTNSPIGSNPTLNELKGEGYEAIFLAIGASRGSRLTGPGSELKGILVGTSFLQEVNLGKRPPVGPKVVVLGGGSVALDCGRTGLRLGASEVHLVCLEDRESMLADSSEIREGLEEGIKLHTSYALRRVLGKDGHVSAVECLRVHSLSFDPEGQPRFETISGSEQVFEADTVIFAIGQSPDLNLFPDIATHAKGTIAADPWTFITNRPGIFAGGDAAGRSASVIEAIAEGRQAASSIHLYLQGLVMKGKRPYSGIKASEIEVKIPPDIQRRARQTMPSLPMIQRRSFQEVSLGLSERAAISEAERCLNCAGHLCREACFYHAPQFGAEEEPKMQMCNLCLDRWSQSKKPICVAACPTRALDAGPIEELRATYGDVRAAEMFTYSASTRPSVNFKPKRD